MSIDVNIGNVKIGGNNPVAIQSMTDTDTEDAKKTAQQIIELVNAGSEIVRVTVNTIEAAKQIHNIKNILSDNGINVPLVGDFHFNGHKILSTVPDAAKSLDKYRINPGNVGKGIKKNEQFAYMINTAKHYNKPIRIGANWGSLDIDVLAKMLDSNAKTKNPLTLPEIQRKLLIDSVIESVESALELGLSENKIVLSAKVSSAQELIAVYRLLSQKTNLPLHLGLTEAGMGLKGIVVSTAALAVLLNEGIGNTIRISLTPRVGESRTQEVLVAKEILQSLELRRFHPTVSSCPGCGRTGSNEFQILSTQIEGYLQSHLPKWKSIYIGIEELKIAVMGCVVNGPGESKLANIGISLPGKGERAVAPVYIDGEKFRTLNGDNILLEFEEIISEYIENKYQKINDE